MVSRLTSSERQIALVTLTLTGLLGLAMAVAGRGDPMGVHGFIVLFASLGMFFVVGSGILRARA